MWSRVGSPRTRKKRAAAARSVGAKIVEYISGKQDNISGRPQVGNRKCQTREESEMKTREETESPKHVSLADVAEAIKAAMPVLDETDQQIATAVHRLMSSGAPVEPAAIAKAVGGVSVERVNERLNTWRTGVNGHSRWPFWLRRDRMFSATESLSLPPTRRATNGLPPTMARPCCRLTKRLRSDAYLPSVSPPICLYKIRQSMKDQFDVALIGSVGDRIGGLRRISVARLTRCGDHA